ncbi:MAG: hypothetical protein NTY74_10965 [Ignavibacteriae bacterium]|nr:hypothetical protein [Ignavibacteriota bacterium]
MNIFLKSDIDVSFFNDIERLFYFNKYQYLYYNRIEETVAKDGIPKFAIENEKIMYKSDNNLYTRVVYAFVEMENNHKLIGVVVYGQLNKKVIEVKHYCIDDIFSLKGIFSYEMLTLRIFKLFINNLSKIKGLEFVVLPYTNKRLKIRNNII